jgi:hypothetical protein
MTFAELTQRADLAADARVHAYDVTAIDGQWLVDPTTAGQWIGRADPMGPIIYLLHPHRRGMGHAEWRASLLAFVCEVCNAHWEAADLRLGCPAHRCHGTLAFDPGTAWFVCSESPQHMIG